jgi:hypothetical protein
MPPLAPFRTDGWKRKLLAKDSSQKEGVSKALAMTENRGF